MGCLDATDAQAHAFDSALLENPNDAAAFTSLVTREVDALLANEARLAPMLDRAIAKGKEQKGNLDNRTVFRQDRTTFRAFLARADFLPTIRSTGTHAWISGRIRGSQAADRDALAAFMAGVNDSSRTG